MMTAAPDRRRAETIIVRRRLLVTVAASNPAHFQNNSRKISCLQSPGFRWGVDTTKKPCLVRGFFVFMCACRLHAKIPNLNFKAHLFFNKIASDFPFIFSMIQLQAPFKFIYFFDIFAKCILLFFKIYSSLSLNKRFNGSLSIKLNAYFTKHVTIV